MLRWFDEILAGKPPWMVGCLVFPLILLLGAIDRLTGYELSISVFYLVPIAIAVWYATRNLGYIASGVSAVSWMIVEGTTTHSYNRHWVLYWNTATRLLFFVVVAYLIAALRSQLMRQQQLARTDNLTGLLNRAGFFDRAALVISAAARYRNTIAVAYVDLDGFKQVNDTLGHFQGDEVLRSLGRLLGRCRRESDIVARLGGDEFAVLLPNTTLAGARFYFTNLHDVLQSEIRQRGWSMLGISIGAAVFDRDAPELSEALQLADRLMYRAKYNGQAGVVVEAAADEA